MWAKKLNLNKCISCKKDTTLHRAKGLCRNCYARTAGYKWQKAYRVKNLYKIRLAQSIYRKKNPQKNGQRSMKARWIERISQRDGMKCYNCHTTKNLTLEHIVPRSIGGKFSYENLKILCFNCNIEAYKILVKKALKFYFQNHTA